MRASVVAVIAALFALCLCVSASLNSCSNRCTTLLYCKHRNCGKTQFRRCLQSCIRRDDVESDAELLLGAAVMSQMFNHYDQFETESDMSHSQALSRISGAGIGITSSGGCSNRNIRTCTSLDGIRDNTINMIITLKRASGCPIIITGGTEVGHAPGAKSHSSGHKLDIGLNSCISGYITRTFSPAGRRGDGATLYKSSAGNVYALEGNHWDILFP